MNTGEDIQGLRKIIDLTRLISITILVLHIYLTCYRAFEHWGFTASLTNRLIGNIVNTRLFSGLLKPKLAALVCLVISLLGVKGKKDEKIQRNSIVAYLLCGSLVYFLSVLALYLPGSIPLIAGLYIALTGIGYLLILTGGTWLSRLIKLNLSKDVFNSDNETFPQEERLLENEHSYNLPTKYRLKGKIRDGWLNCLNPYRSTLVSGSAGSGKTYFVIRHIIDQHLKKGFAMFLYDFKYDDLSKMAYNKLLKYYKNYKVRPKFFVIDLENPKHRCNPLDPESMLDITDATESSRTNMLKIDISQIGQQGDTFFSPADSAYLVFMVIGIVGYFTVPNVANYIVHAGGGNAMLQKVNTIVTGGMSTGVSAAQGGAGMIVDRFDNARSNLSQGMAEASGNDYFKDKISGTKNS